MRKQKQQVIELWSEEVVMVRQILKEVCDEAVERVGRREELENEIEVIYEFIRGEEKRDGGITAQKEDQEGKGMTRLEEGRRWRTRRKAKGNKQERPTNKITKYYKRKGGEVEELIPNKKKDWK